MLEFHISTYRNEHGYWVARVDSGEYKNTRAWASSKRRAVHLLRSALSSIANDTAKVD